MSEPEIRPVAPLPGRGGEEPPLTVLSEGDLLRGRLEMRGDGQLLGSFEGELECAGELLVGPEARVNAQIRARHLTISGLVTGNVVARGRLKITATGRLQGDAEVAALVVQEGGVHYGVLRVHPEGVPEPELQAPWRPEPAQQTPPEPRLAEPALAPAATPGAKPLAVSVDRVRRMWGELF